MRELTDAQRRAMHRKARRMAAISRLQAAFADLLCSIAYSLITVAAENAYRSEGVEGPLRELVVGAKRFDSDRKPRMVVQLYGYYGGRNAMGKGTDVSSALDDFLTKAQAEEEE